MSIKYTFSFLSFSLVSGFNSLLSSIFIELGNKACPLVLKSSNGGVLSPFGELVILLAFDLSSFLVFAFTLNSFFSISSKRSSISRFVSFGEDALDSSFIIFCNSDGISPPNFSNNLALSFNLFSKIVSSWLSSSNDLTDLAS